METLLLIAILLPLAGAVAIGRDAQSARWLSLGITLAVLACACMLVAAFPVEGPQAGQLFAPLRIPWPDIGAQASHAGLSPDAPPHMALDGLSLWLFALTALLMVVCVAISWQAIDQQVSLYYRLLLILETGMLGVFAAQDIILFYVFFEFTLIPLFFIIGIWGSEQRRWAAIKFFLYTLAGSVLTLLALLAIVIWDYYHGTSGRLNFSIPLLAENLQRNPIDPQWQVLIFLGLFAGFAIKVPLFPLHTWLPLAHVQAPAAGSVLLAGVLLKIGTYGFVRFCLPLLPEATTAAMPWMLWLSLAGIIYGALVALAQSDFKRLIAYSSISHMGFCMLGIFALNRLGLQGAVLQMVNHGLSTGGLFAIVGMIYERYHTRQIADLAGLARRTPILALFAVLLALSSIGLPGLNGFVGELLVLVGMFQRGWAEAPAQYAAQYRVIAVLATLGVVLAAWYMLWMVQRVFFGPLCEPKAAHAHPAGAGGPPDSHGSYNGKDLAAVRDLSIREILALAPLAVLIVWIGVWPQFFLARIAPTVDPYASRYENIIQAASGPQQATAGLHSRSRSRLDAGDRPEGAAAPVASEARRQRPSAISFGPQQPD